jgi:hypothetical protein
MSCAASCPRHKPGRSHRPVRGGVPREVRKSLLARPGRACRRLSRVWRASFSPRGGHPLPPATATPRQEAPPRRPSVNARGPPAPVAVHGSMVMAVQVRARSGIILGHPAARGSKPSARVLRRIGPRRAGHFGLRSHVDATEVHYGCSSVDTNAPVLRCRHPARHLPGSARPCHQRGRGGLWYHGKAITPGAQARCRG